MSPAIQALYADLAKTLKVDKLLPDAEGTVQLTVGKDSTVLIFAETASSVMLAAPVMQLPAKIDYGRMLWLLRRNFYDSSLAPFHIGCDSKSQIIIWGRVPVAGLSGEEVANLIDAVATEAGKIREEVAVED